MLWNSKETTINSITKKAIEFREGCNGSGNPVYIIVTYYTHTDKEYTTNYHEEWFTNYNEAMNWYNLTN